MKGSRFHLYAYSRRAPFSYFGKREVAKTCTQKHWRTIAATRPLHFMFPKLICDFWQKNCRTSPDSHPDLFFRYRLHCTAQELRKMHRTGIPSIDTSRFTTFPLMALTSLACLDFFGRNLQKFNTSNHSDICISKLLMVKSQATYVTRVDPFIRIIVCAANGCSMGLRFPPFMECDHPPRPFHLTPLISHRHNPPPAQYVQVTITTIRTRLLKPNPNIAMRQIWWYSHLWHSL